MDAREVKRHPRDAPLQGSDIPTFRLPGSGNPGHGGKVVLTTEYEVNDK